MIGTVDGSTIMPSTSPSDLMGRLTVRGTGYLTFTSVNDVAGMRFLAGGPQNRNTSFMTFAGPSIGSLFKDKGEISFSLKSAYTFVERKALPSPDYRYVFDVYDDSGAARFYFTTSTQGDRLVFEYRTGGTNTISYSVPAGQEDVRFGRDVVADIRLTWNGTSTTLYFNGTAVNTTAYTKVTPNWGPLSFLVIGSSHIRNGGGGFFSLSDAVADIQIR